MEESANLEQVQLSAESADFASQDPVEKAVQEEDKNVNTFINHVAANSGISTRLALVYSQKSFCINTLSLEKHELDMVILAQLQAFSKDKEADTARVHTKLHRIYVQRKANMS